MPSTTQPRPELDADLARRLAACAGRLTSGHDGERLAACAAIERLLEPRGLRLGELLENLADRPPASRPRPARPPRDRDRELLALVLAEADRLDPWKRRFAESLRPWAGPFTPKQAAKLREIGAGLGLEVRS